jgi:hypothetical protein
VSSSGIVWSGSSQLTLRPALSQPAQMLWTGVGRLTMRPTNVSGVTQGYISWSGHSRMLLITPVGGSSPLTPGTLLSAAARGHASLRLTLRGEQGRETADLALADIDRVTVDSTHPVKVSGSPTVYMSPVRGSIELRRGKGESLGDALVTLRWRKTSEED